MDTSKSPVKRTPPRAIAVPISPRKRAVPAFSSSQSSPALSATTRSNASNDDLNSKLDPSVAVQLGLGSAGYKIFVGGLHPNVSRHVLRDYFTQYGTVANAFIIPDRYFGFVTFQELRSVVAVLTAGRKHWICLGDIKNHVEIRIALPAVRSLPLLNVDACAFVA